MYLQTSELRHQIYNILLWTPTKTEAKKYVTEGLVKFNIVNGMTSWLSSDGYVVVQSGEYCDNPKGSFFRGEDLKELLRSLPLDDEKIEVTSGDGGYFFGKTFLEPQTPSNPDIFESVLKVMTTAEELPSSSNRMREFYLSNRRLQKFSLVEPRDSYPLAMKLATNHLDQDLLMWKYGPKLRGIFAPLMVEAIIEAFPDDHGEVMW